MGRNGREFLLRNCLPYDRRDRVLPVIERSADTFSQLRTLLGDFQTEAAHHASGDRCLLAIDLPEIAEVTPQALQWRSRRVVQDSRRMLPLAHPIPFQGSCGEVLFATEMVIKEPLGTSAAFKMSASPVALYPFWCIRPTPTSIKCSRVDFAAIRGLLAALH
jgi:hypothetical protein